MTRKILLVAVTAALAVAVTAGADPLGKTWTGKGHVSAGKTWTKAHTTAP